MSQWSSSAVKHRDYSQPFGEISATGLAVNGLIPFDSNYLQLHPGVQFCLVLRATATKELLKMSSLPWFLFDIPLEALSYWGERSLLPQLLRVSKNKMLWEDLKKWLMLEGNKKSVMTFSPSKSSLRSEIRWLKQVLKFDQ